METGVWFEVPLDDDTSAAGIVTAWSSRNVILAYLFGPYRGRPNVPGDVAAHQAAMVCRTDGDPIVDGRWPRLGMHRDHRESDWPVPVFGRLSAFGNAYRITYDPADPGIEVETRRVDASDIDGLPKDGLYGYLALEAALASMFGVAPPKQPAGTPTDDDLGAVLASMDDAADFLADVPRRGWPLVVTVLRDAARSSEALMDRPEATRVVIAAMLVVSRDAAHGHEVPEAVRRVRAKLSEPGPRGVDDDMRASLVRVAGSELADLLGEAGETDRLRDLLDRLMAGGPRAQEEQTHEG